MLRKSNFKILALIILGMVFTISFLSYKIYLEKKYADKDFKNVDDAYLCSCGFYETNFKNVKCGYISKSLKLFSYILSIKQVYILRIYLEIRYLLMYKKAR